MKAKPFLRKYKESDASYLRRCLIIRRGIFLRCVRDDSIYSHAVVWIQEYEKLIALEPGAKDDFRDVFESMTKTIVELRT